MPSKSHISVHSTTLLILFTAFACTFAAAQEIPSRNQGMSLQAFGLVSYVQPHFDPSNNLGGGFGADLNFRPLYKFQPSLELRATFASGADVSETTYDFGPRLEVDYGRFKPYVTALIGKGNITFQHPVTFPTGPYTHDDSFVFSGAIGADYMVTRQIGLRGEIMVQRWNLGGSNVASGIPFYPHLYSAGVDYRFDFNLMRRKKH